MTTTKTYDGYGGCMLTLILPILIITSIGCRVSRNTQTSHVAVDSAVTHVKDSMGAISRSIEQKYQQRIQELVNSSVVFETQPCPDTKPLREMLDSIGKVNYDLFIRKDSIIRALQNKVTVSANGAISASGQIKSVTVSNSRLMEENASLSQRNDSLWRVVDSQRVSLNKQVDTKVKVVEKKFIPWWIFLAMAGIALVAYAVAWWRHHGGLT